MNSLPGNKASATRFFKALVSAWNPERVPRPSISSDLERLPAVERITEVVRFDALAAEHSLSPRGGLRAWLKLNVLAALVIGAPALIVVPVATYLLGGVATWSQLLLSIAVNLLMTAVAVLGTLLVLLLIAAVLRRISN